MKSLHQFFTITLLVLVGCRGGEKPSTFEAHNETENIIEVTDEQIKTAGVTLGKIEQRQISGVVKANGVLDVPPQQLVSVSVPFGGFLKSTELLQGTRVKRGQLIATLENTEYIQLQQDYLQAKNKSDFYKVDYERQVELSKDNVNAAKTLQQAKTDYLNSLTMKSALAAKLKLINISAAALTEDNIASTANVYSPIDGYVTEVNVNIGSYVAPSNVLFKIVDTEHLHAELTIFEKDVRKLQIGQKVRFILANETSERIAKVYLIGREIRQDRTITIHCHLEKEDKGLLPGMFLKAVVETGGAMVDALPNDAVVDYQGRKYILLVTTVKHEKAAAEGDIHNHEKHFELVEVEAGSSENGYTEVHLPEGVDINREIAISGGYAVLAKMKNVEEGE